tara:strand:+ start:1489 stop:1968 length:480 start_codon:yes stop_codon:yes gene_type:complete
MKKTWVEIKRFKFVNLQNPGLKFLNNRKFKTSPWIRDIIKKYKYNLKNFNLPIKLVRIKVKELGFKKPAMLKEIYNKAKLKGLYLVPPAIAIYSRLLYTNQKSGEWIRFATPLNSMIDSDGVPHLPKLGKALSFFFLETYWSYPKAIFHPKNEFIFIKK